MTSRPDLDPRAAAALAAGLVRPTLEVIHGLRPRRQLTRHVSPALGNAIAWALRHRDATSAVSTIGQIRWQVTGQSATFSGTYRTTDGRVWPVSGDIRRHPSTGRPMLVSLETAYGRHTLRGPQPAANRSRIHTPGPRRAR